MPAIVARLRAAGCVFAADEARLLVRTARTPADLSAMLDRRAAGTPLEHVLGWAEFCGLRLTVEPGVFVPRRRTEFLVQQAIVLARRSADEPGVIVDLCCRAGAVPAGYGWHGRARSTLAWCPALRPSFRHGAKPGSGPTRLASPPPPAPDFRLRGGGGNAW